MVSPNEPGSETELATATVRELDKKLGKMGLAYNNGETPPYPGQCTPWRIGAEPFPLNEDLGRQFEKLGPAFLEFYEACNRLYRRARRDERLSWVLDYLYQGKPETVIDYGRMNRFKNDLPRVIRPDIIPTENGIVVTELDSVPGGIGSLAGLSRLYADVGHEIYPAATGMLEGFAAAMRAEAAVPDPVVVIVVSEESAPYWSEMEYLARTLNSEGKLDIHARRPEELTFKEEGLFFQDGGALRRIDLIYRFFELFDLKNIPKMDLILYAVRKELVRITPPLKSHLEEKMLFALFHNRRLQDYWEGTISEGSLQLLRRVLPQTWIVDPRPLPPQAVIPGLEVDGQPVTDWEQLKDLSQRQRRLVLKPSGFSELAWGSRGVHIGHDMSGQDWADAIDAAIDSFGKVPYILQPFHKGRRVRVSYYDGTKERIRLMSGRTRLCPYYFVGEHGPELGGVLATVCPANKKAIHGMTDAVMVPCTLVS